MLKKETWNNLPREILNLIVNYCGGDCSQVKWMFANKKWFDFYLSQKYNTICIDLDVTNKKVNKILSSSFDPGKWVKCIRFNRFESPKNVDQLDMGNDTLIRLMKQTPNVDKIRFLCLQDLNITAWTYLYVALSKTNIWKLQILPEKEAYKLAYSPFYYLCAYCMRCTLKKLYLSYGMIGALDFEHLKGFKVLEDLYVSANVLYNFDDLHSLLQYVPNLKEVTVNFSDKSINLSPNQSSEQKDHIIYSNIKKLTLYNYTPLQNEQLLVFTEQFTKLDELCITGKNVIEWPGNKVDPSVTDIFLNGISSISEYRITVPGGAQGAFFIGKWLKLMEESNQKIQLSIVYVTDNVNIVTIGRRNVSVAAKPSQYDSISTLYLQYQMAYNSSYSSERISAVTNTIDKALQVEIDGDPKPASLLRAIVEKNQPNLKKLILKNSTFTLYTSSTNTTTVSQHIKSIIFCDCCINYNTITLFLDKFDTLDYVSFDGCFSGEFPNSDWSNQWISMPHVTVGTLNLSNIREMFGWQKNYLQIPNIVIIRVNINYTRDKCYALIENNIIEITLNLFKVYRRRFKREEMIVVKICVNSIKELSLALMDSSKKFNIKFPR